MSAGHVITGAGSETETLALAELLDVSGSEVVELTNAELAIVAPGASEQSAVTTIVTVAEPPEAIVPSEHVTGPVPPTGGVVHEPWLDEAEAKVVPAGVWSVTVTPEASSGPAFETVTV